MCLNTDLTVSYVSHECDDNVFEDIIKDETKFDKLIGHKYELQRNIGKPIMLKEEFNNMILQIQSLQMNNNLLGYLATFSNNQNIKARYFSKPTSFAKESSKTVRYKRLVKATDAISIIKLAIAIAIMLILSYISAVQGISSRKISALSSIYFNQHSIISWSLSALYFEKTKINETGNQYLQQVLT